MPKNIKKKKDGKNECRKGKSARPEMSAVEFSVDEDNSLIESPSDEDVEEYFKLAKSKEFKSGIYNYCDRWCEKCTDTNKCFLFASEERRKTKRGPGRVGKNDLIEEVSYNFKMAEKIMIKATKERGINLDEAGIDIPDMDQADEKFEKYECLVLARDYFTAVNSFLKNYYKTQEQYKNELQLEIKQDDINEQIEIITWYHSLLPSKIWRLLYERQEIKKENDPELKRMIKDDFNKFTALVEKIINNSRQAISRLAQKRTEYRVQTSDLMLRLNLTELSLREELSLSPAYGVFTGKFNPVQIAAMEEYGPNPLKGIEKALDYFLARPDDSSSYGIIGDMYINSGQFQKAVPFLRAGARFSPRDPLLFFLWGIALAKSGRFNEGLKRLKQAAEINPDEMEIKRNIGWVTAMRGRFKDSKKEIEKGRAILKEVIKKEPANALAMTDLGQSYLMAYDFDRAFEWMERARKIEPDNDFVNMIYNDLVEMRKQAVLEPGFKELIAKQKAVKAYSGPEPKDDKDMDDMVAKQFEIEETINELNSGNLSAEETAQVMKKLEQSGLVGQITAVTDPNSPESKTAAEYIEYHRQVRDVEKKITLKETREIDKQLSNPKASIKIQKRGILILAHQGTEYALEILEKHAPKAKGEMRTWFKMAISECRAFLGSDGENPGMFFNKI